MVAPSNLSSIASMVWKSIEVLQFAYTHYEIWYFKIMGLVIGEDKDVIHNTNVWEKNDL